MLSKKIEDVENPIVYIFLVLATSSIYYGINEDFKELSIFIVGFFFLSMFYYCGIRFSSIMILFFLIGIYINSSYYNINFKMDGEIRILKVTNYNVIVDYEGKNLILKSKLNNLNTGDRYYITGEIQNISDKSKGIVGEIIPYDINKINGDFLSGLYDTKRKIYSLLEENLGSRKAGLISSIAFGYSDYLDEEDKDDMKNFGIIHSISVSGLHVVIVYGVIKKIVGDKFGLLGTLIYVVFTGYNYASIRAFIMLASVEGARIFKRNNSSINGLFLSAIILTIFKPYSIFEISFDLSYLATLGIILYNKKINYKLYRLPEKIRDSLSLTLSAQIFTFPYLIFVFKDFSMNFIIGNLVLVPLIDIIVVTGNILPIVFKIPLLFDFLSYINLYIIKIFDWTLDKINQFTLPMFYGNEYMVSFYIMMLISFYFFKKGYKKFVYIPGIFIIVLIIQLYSPVVNINSYKEGAILVAYKGDRILISNKDGIDLNRLSKISAANRVYKKGKTFNISEECYIKALEKDFLLITSKEKYLLKMSTSKNEYRDYDIINFKDGNTNKILIVKGKIYFS